MLVGVQVGLVDLSSSQLGPHVHSIDDFVWSADVPQVSRSAGLSAEGVNEQVAVGKASQISLTHEWLGIGTLVDPV